MAGGPWVLLKERRVEMAPAVLGTLLLSVAAGHPVRLTASLAGAVAVCAVLGIAPFPGDVHIAASRTG